MTTRYRTLPTEVTAVQWWKHGDSPHVTAIGFFHSVDRRPSLLTPGDWIVTHPNGSVEHVTQADFPKRFEKCADHQDAHPNPL